MVALRNWIARTLAEWRVRKGHAQRICAPGKWVVWREGDVVMSRKLSA